MTDKIKVRYLVKNTWPYSIDDESVKGGKIETIEVYASKTFIKGGKRYYRMMIGHGVWTDLLVEE